MVEEHEFLHRAGVHLAVFGKLHGGLGEAVWLLRGIQAEGIRLGLHAAGQGVGYRRQHEHEDGEQRREQRQPGHVADAAQVPAPAPTAFRPGKAPAHEGEAEHDDDAEKDAARVHVVEHVMAHLVPEHGLDFRRAPALEQIVVETDPRGA
ncbi:MAG TPA: hypothetical protein VLZ55_06535, partial [Rhodanobacter sp.]|nr:hypothetical protein [Rhodanobacter sp.]